MVKHLKEVEGSVLEVMGLRGRMSCQTDSISFKPFFVYGLLTSLIALLIALLTRAGGLLTYVAISVSGLVCTLLLSVSLCQSKHIQVAVVSAWAARIALLVLFILSAWYSGKGAHYLRSGDATNYHEWAQSVIAGGEWELWGGLPAYTYIVAGIYMVFGPDPNVVNLVNMCLSLCLIPLASELGRRCGGRHAAIITAWLVALYPSLLLWSISGVKDVYITLATVLTAFMTTGLSAGQYKVADVIRFAVGAFMLIYLRLQFLLSLLLALGATVLLCTDRYRSSRGRWKWFASVAVVVVIGSLALLSPLGKSVLLQVSRLQQEEVWQHSQDIAFRGGSGISILANIPARFRWIAQFPFVVFAPFPWQWLTIGTGINRLIAVEMMAMYVLMAIVFRRRRVLRGNPIAKSLLIYAVSIAVAVSFSLPNLGSIHRYRLSAVVMMLPVAALALVSRRRGRVTS